MKNSIEKGFTLLEMLLVLVIAVIFIVMSTRYYESYKKTRDIGFFQTHVSELMNGLNNYYFMHCRWDTIPVGNLIPDMEAAGLIGKNINNPWRNFSAEIENKNTINKFYLLKVTATISVPNNTSQQNIALAAYLRGALNADSVGTGSTVVTWTRLPLNTRDDLSSHQWIMNQGPGQQFMPGRFTTAVNTGTGSKFWILNSNLQSFTNGSDPKYAENCPN